MKWLVVCVMTLSVAFSAVAQTVPARPASAAAQPEAPKPTWAEGGVWVGEGQPPILYAADTPEKRKERFGLTADPGLDPDAKTVIDRKGLPFVIQKFDRKGAVYAGVRRGWVRPMWAV